MIIYNFACSILNGVCVILFFLGIYLKGELFTRKTNLPTKIAFNIYYFSKVFELLDTVFMVIRHKRRQITFLHVFHHATMVLLCNFGVITGYRISFSYPMGVNSLIHVFMYAYYGLSAAGSPLVASQVIKKRLTQMQLAQFYTDLVPITYGWYLGQYCIYSLFYAFSMIALFSNFYVKAYWRKEFKKINGEGKEEKAD